MCILIKNTGDPRLINTSILATSGTVALIVSGFTQETFYSQPAMGNFMGMYFILLILIMRLKSCYATTNITVYT